MQAGVVLAGGKYRIEGELGAGGMGTVLAARDLILDRAVAIKVLRGESSPDRQERLLREARAVARLESDHIVRILDTGTTDEGQMFIVMERLEGRDLDKHLRRHGALPATEAVHYVLQAAEALAHAHQAGIVHRDIKPSNMFLVRRSDGRRIVKLLDFGIARGQGGASLTHTGMLGTPHYMSPEQIRNAKDVDVRSDVWSLGVTLYQLLSAALPFKGVSLNEVVMNILESEPATLVALGLEVPEGLDPVIRKCLAQDREDRYATVLDLADALLPFAPPEGRSLRDGIWAVMRDEPPTMHAPSSPKGRPPTSSGGATDPFSIAPASTTEPGALLGPTHMDSARQALATSPMESAAATVEDREISATLLAQDNTLTLPGAVRAAAVSGAALPTSVPATVPGAPTGTAPLGAVLGSSGMLPAAATSTRSMHPTPTSELDAVAATLGGPDRATTGSRSRATSIVIALVLVGIAGLGAGLVVRWTRMHPPSASPATTAIAESAPAPLTASAPPSTPAAPSAASPAVAPSTSTSATAAAVVPPAATTTTRKPAAPARSAGKVPHAGPGSTETLPEELRGRK